MTQFKNTKKEGKVCSLVKMELVEKLLFLKSLKKCMKIKKTVS